MQNCEVEINRLHANYLSKEEKKVLPVIHFLEEEEGGKKDTVTFLMFG